MTKTQIISMVVILLIVVGVVYFWRVDPVGYFGQTGSVNQSVDQETIETNVSTSSEPFDFYGKG